MTRKYTDSINKFFSKVYIGISSLFFGELEYKLDQEVKKDLEYFKNEAFHKLGILFIVLGLIPIGYGSYLFFKENNVIAGMLELLIYFVVLLLLRSNRIKILTKRYVFVLCVFLLGLMLLFVVGPIGAGMIVIFSAFGLAACILNRRQNTIFILIGFFVFIVTSILFNLGFLDNMAIYNYGESWYIVAISTQCIGALFMVGINNLFKNIMNQAEEAEKSAKVILESEKMYKLLFESSGVLIGYYSPKGIIMSYNIRAAEYMGGTPEEFIGKNITDIIPEADANKYMIRITDALSSDTTMEYEDLLSFSIGEKWILSTFNKITNLKDEAIGVQIVSIDINDRKEAEDRLVYSSIHDDLTGLYNRKYFEEAKSKVDKDINVSYAIIIIDINGVRLTNDAFGFSEGDRMIIETAKMLQSCCCGNEILARIGGDEFGILIRSNEEEAEDFVQYIKSRCYEYNQALTNKEMDINLSFGYSLADMNKNLDKAQKEAMESLNKNKMLESKSHQNSIITSIMATLFERSNETKEHADRIAVFCNMIGERLNLSQNSLDQLNLFSKLHDVGKIGIDGSILKKPDKLNSDEWIEMKKHPEIGYRIAMSTPELKSSAEFILSHHERWDGKGYPQGLSGEEIPLLSRILAIADAYDAMTEDRVYRKAMTSEDAVAEIRRNAGTQFDPQLAELFVELIQEKLKN